MLIIGSVFLVSTPAVKKWQKSNENEVVYIKDELKSRILTLISQIPKARVATYGQLASLAGAPWHARLVGRILRRLPPDTRLPWFRVISASGRISNPDAAEQRRRLEADGVAVSSNDRVTLAQFQWRP